MGFWSAVNDKLQDMKMKNEEGYEDEKRRIAFCSDAVVMDEYKRLFRRGIAGFNDGTPGRIKAVKEELIKRGLLEENEEE